MNLKKELETNIKITEWFNDNNFRIADNTIHNITDLIDRLVGIFEMLGYYYIVRTNDEIGGGMLADRIFAISPNTPDKYIELYILPRDKRESTYDVYITELKNYEE